MPMELVTANLAGKVRREKLFGRDFFVAPVSMIVPGVLNGSKGPLLYPPDETQRNPEAWNNMPIVVYHPMDSQGKPISARDPEILNKQGVGYVFRTNHDNKLGAEGWFDAELTRKVDSRVYNALDKNLQMELSTGLFTRDEPAPTGATFNGMLYTHIARDHKPDHLAVLPDKIGACSIKDGCGLNVNEAPGMWSRFLEWLGLSDLVVMTENAGMPSAKLDMTPEKACKILEDGSVNGKPLTHRQRGMFGAMCGRRKKPANNTSDNASLDDLLEDVVDCLTENAKREMSFSDRRNKIEAAFRAMYPVSYSSDSVVDSPYIVEIYDNYLICRKGGELYQHSYTIDKSGTVTITSDSKRVERVTTYEPVKTNSQGSGSLVTANSQGEERNMLTAEQKKAIVDGLITNCGCQGPKIWTENERDYLLKLPDERLQSLDESRKRVAANEAIIANVKKGITAGDHTVTLNASGELEATKKTVKQFTDPEGKVYVFNDQTNSYVLQGQQSAGTQQQSLPQTLNDETLFRLMSPQARGAIQTMMRTTEQHKASLIDVITANTSNVFTKEQLAAMEPSMLENIAKMAGNQQPQQQSVPFLNFAGAAAPFSANARGSRFEPGEDSDMAPPVINWQEEAKKSA